MGERTRRRLSKRFDAEIYALTRIIVGFLFLLHGGQKLFGWFGGPSGEMPPPLLYIGGGVELVGGALIALGFLAGPAAFICSGQMAVAYFMFHQPQRLLPIQNYGERTFSLRPHYRQDNQGNQFSTPSGELGFDYLSWRRTISGAWNIFDQSMDSICSQRPQVAPNDTPSTGKQNPPSDLRYQTFDDPLGRDPSGRSLARGELLPWDWVEHPTTVPESSGFEVSSRQEILYRLAPNTAVDGEYLTDPQGRPIPADAEECRKLGRGLVGATEERLHDRFAEIQMLETQIHDNRDVWKMRSDRDRADRRVDEADRFEFIEVRVVKADAAHQYIWKAPAAGEPGTGLSGPGV